MVVGPLSLLVDLLQNHEVTGHHLGHTLCLIALADKNVPKLDHLDSFQLAKQLLHFLRVLFHGCGCGWPVKSPLYTVFFVRLPQQLLVLVEALLPLKEHSPLVVEVDRIGVLVLKLTRLRLHLQLERNDKLGKDLVSFAWRRSTFYRF